MDKTNEAVVRQIGAMGSAVFEVGLFNPNARPATSAMLPRTWDADALVRSIPWLRYQNREGRNIYIRPAGEHNLTLVDDLTRSSVTEMKRTGFEPALITETSPGNYQAWLKHPEVLPKELGTAAARSLAAEFGGDPGAADWRHFGRLCGFTNRKIRHQNGITGLFPFVRLVEATGNVYTQADTFLGNAKAQHEQDRREHERRTQQMNGAVSSSELKTIDAFRANAKYGGDATRVDLAYALYAFLRGAPESQIRTAIGSRDLSHKGNERRQEEYIDRTVKKAFGLVHSRGR